MPDLTPGQKLIAAYHGGEIADWPDLARAIDEAIAGEREACAQIADDECVRILSKQDGRDGSVDLNLRLVAVMLPEIASAIRARGETGSHG